MFKKISNKIDHSLSQDKLIIIIKKFDEFFSKLPNLPDFLPKFFLTISPWLALASGIIGILAGPLMAILGLLSLVTLSPLIILSYISSAFIMILNTFLMFKAFKPLKKKSLQGWIYIFWSEILWLINGVIETLSGEQTWWVLLVSNLIGFYLLFEMKRIINQEETKNKPKRVKDRLRGKKENKNFDVVG
ncbi:MAG: hypothetical protein U9O78_02885 [Patescibacteria group bacterium]|nr:hypothetical protein [Patescibacteria group bacterium]